MNSLIWPNVAILVRPSTSTYRIAPRYSGGRNFVNASRVSYMWLSPSKTENPSRGVIEFLLVPGQSALPQARPHQRRPSGMRQTLASSAKKEDMPILFRRLSVQQRVTCLSRRHHMSSDGIADCEEDEVDLGLTREQRAVSEAFAALFDKQATPQRVRAAESSPTIGFDQLLWRHYVDMGALGIGVPSDCGGG